jgi:hypothetical protein
MIGMKRFVSFVLAVAQFVSVIVVVQFVTALPARAAFACNAGNDGAAGTLSGTGANTYYQPPLGTISAGTTSVPLGTIDNGGGGGSTAVGVNDLLLIMQMQDGTFTNTNSSSYGTGASLGNAGLYEYVQVVSVAAGTATILGAGGGGGLINSYTEAAATGLQGQRTYQIIRVPQYLTATLGSSYTAAYWDGKTGGVAALDVASTLNLGGASVYATGDGFRGGGASVASTSPATVLNTDYVDSATMNGTNPSTNPPAFGFKGEGIFGTPDYVFGYTTFTTPSTPTGPTITKVTANADGYPGGDVGMGAPGDGGGGGTDMNPATNDSNTGGGGGSNAGSGGNGGYPWSTVNPKYSQTSPAVHLETNYATVDATHNPDLGGRGATAVATGIRAIMGGGGGGGSNNNGSNNNSYNNYGSSGGTGGGIVMMRIASTSGAAATIYADGTTGLAPDNDGGGGGGAGGTVVITSPNAFSGLTVYARGAAGTSAYFTGTDTTLTTAHGPGGGGGGGVILSSSSVGATTTGGANGVTVSGQAIAYGSTSGTGGTSGIISASSIPGVPSGAECYSSTSVNTPFIGPIDPGEPSFFGADETGSYNGVTGVSNNNDFTASSMSLANASATPTNTGTVPGTWIGSTFTFSSAPTIQIAHQLSYKAPSNAAKQVVFTATAPQVPASWTVQICPDTGTGTAATTPNCGLVANLGCTNARDGTWTNVTAASVSTNTATFCNKNNTIQRTRVFWTVYTPAAGTYATFNRYDAVITADDGTFNNSTHDEIYAGFVPITKTTTIATNGCPAGVTPPVSGVCPGGTIRYTLDFRNVMVGAGQGTEGQLLSAFAATKAGTLVLTDTGNATFTNGAGPNNTATYTNGLASIMATAAGTYASCSATANSCGVTTNSGGAIGATVFTGNALASTAFTATVGGASFQLVPSGYTLGANLASQGTLVFAEVVK